jgi:hypothetical protein
MISGNLNFLEPSGPLQACNGTALPFTFLGEIRTMYVLSNYRAILKFFKELHWEIEVEVEDDFNLK